MIRIPKVYTTEITFISRKLEGYRRSGLGARPITVDGPAGRQKSTDKTEFIKLDTFGSQV